MLRNILNEKNEFNVEDILEIYSNEGKFSLSGKKIDNAYVAEDDRFLAESKVLKDETGIYQRKDKFVNKSENSVSVNSISSRFLFDGGEYQVYTQSSVWQNESTGMWQPLNTGIISFGESIRTSEGSAPFVAIWNEQTNTGMAFHIFPESMWKIEVKKILLSGFNCVIEVKIGIDNKNLSFNLNKGESIELPEILYYTFKNKTDMDCYKLHRYLHKNYPRREMPVIFNSWLSDFDNISYNKLVKQAEIASELGVEYFVVDAGWFGNHSKKWENAIGDWIESDTGKLGGRLKDVSDAVRLLGMKFGLWFEPERAVEGADCVKEHPEYYIKDGDNYFIDYTNDKAIEYLLENIGQTISNCNIEYVKFDANADLRIDPQRTSFINYHKGYKKFIEKFRERFPKMYLEGCAAGGMKMDLSYLRYADSFWFTDNQSPFDGLQIYKNTIIRMLPQAIDKVATITSIRDVICTYTGDTDLLVASNNGTWDDFKVLNKSFLFGFLSGTPVEISCDLSALSEDVHKEMKEFIGKFKKERELLKQTECRILTDTETMLVLQYNDKEFNNIKIVVYALRIMQDKITVYPEVDKNCRYVKISEETEYDGEKGIDVSIEKQYTSYIIDLKKI